MNEENTPIPNTNPPYQPNTEQKDVFHPKQSLTEQPAYPEPIPTQQPNQPLTHDAEPITTQTQAPEALIPTVPTDNVRQDESSPAHREAHRKANSKQNNEYNSNPFVVAGKGLGSALIENPTSAILIAFVPIIVILPSIFIVGIVTGLLSLIGGTIGALLGGLIALVVTIAVVLLIIRVAAGSLNILLKSIDNEKISTKEAIGSISSGSLTSFVFTNLLTFIAVFVGLLFFIIPGIYLLARLSLAPVIVYAEDKKARDALMRSMALTKGHVFEMLGALSAQSMLSGGGLLSTIGTSSGVVKRYKELTTAENSGITDTGKVHWLNYVVPVFMTIFLIGYFVVLILSSTINQDNNNNFNDFNNDSFINDDYRFDDSDFNSDLDSYDNEIYDTLEDGASFQ